LARKKTHNNDKQGVLFNEIKPLTINQSNYCKSIDQNIITVAAGYAGTGKTILSINKACKALVNGEIDQILVSRSIIGCGRELGALPGDVDEKVHAYFLPIIEYFDRFLGRSVVRNLIRDERIKLLPVELIRGHTYDKTYMILEEVQNCDIKQLKLFMSRIGKNSKMILIGDEKQSDIPRRDSCIHFLLNQFAEMDDIGIVRMEFEDIMRHPIIADILAVFDRHEY
jgi:phosphate starvation-inducible PhoH-like protein